TGEARVRSENRLLTTVAYQLQGKRTFALEGSIFSAGSVVQWLRDELKIIEEAAETEDLAPKAPEDTSVYVIPAFTGLGAPYWDPGARAGIIGLTRDSGRAHIARAALESVGYQTRDLFESMAADGAPSPRELRVDGGMVVNDWVVQFLADILGVRVRRPENIETTAMGAAFLAGLGAGIFGGLEDLVPLARADRTFVPQMEDQLRERKFAGWRAAIGRVRTR
ncbi:MAG: FGGY family carbohydrate kinase, partial [Chloroflexota bacterium]